MTDFSATISEIHAVYVHATGYQIRLAYDREAAWYQFLKDGFTADDLLTVINWLKREIKAGKRWEASLLFRNLVVQLDRFEEDLSVAKAHARKPVETPRDKAVRELRPVAQGATTATVTAKPASEAAQKALEALQREKQRIFGG